MIGNGLTFCDHGRLSDGCEDCALLVAMERGYRPPPGHAPPVPEPERAEQDLYCDCGDGRYVFIAAGDPIPASLAGLPRVPRTPPSAQDHPAATKPPGKRG